MASISFHTDSEIRNIANENHNPDCLSLQITHRLCGDHVYSADWLTLHGTAESHRAFAQAILDALDNKGFTIAQPPEAEPTSQPEVMEAVI